MTWRGPPPKRHVRTIAPERLVARVLRDVLAEQRFETFGDLKEALKGRCARLKIPYDAALADRACVLVGSHQPLVFPRARPPAPIPRGPVTWRMRREDAAAIWTQWMKGTT